MPKKVPCGWRVEVELRRTKEHAYRCGLEFSLTDEEARAIITGPCHYSGQASVPESPHGIDRLDSLRGYHLDNCVPACTPIIKMKRSMPESDFWRVIRVCYEWKYKAV